MKKIEQTIILEMIRKNLIKTRKKASGYESRLMYNNKTYSAFAKTEKLALLKLEQKILSLVSDKKEEVITYGAWLNKWLITYKKPKLKESSLYGINVVIRLHIPETLKNMLITDIKSYMLEEALIKVERSRTRQMLYCVFTDSFDKAYKSELIEKDISRLLEPVKHIKKKGNALSSDEQVDFLNKIKNHSLEPFFKFCLYSGCRRSEALNLKWSDIDFNKKIIKIRGTKTIKSYRILPLFPDLLNMLSTLEQKVDRLFLYSPDYVTKTFKKFCPNHKLHDLRHTFATRAMECGISVAVVSSWLGHSNIDTTSRVYTHVLDDYQKTEALKLKI